MNPIRLRVLPALQPVDGREIELQVGATHIQWRYVPDHNGTPDWADLIAIADLIGPEGPAIEMRSDGTSIQYRPVGTVTWFDIIPISDLTGPPGPPGPAGPDGPPGPVSSIVAGNGITVDITNPSAPVIAISVSVLPQGRLTLSSSTTVSEADIVGATSIYYLPSGGIYVPIYNGTAFAALSFGAGLTLALDSNAAHAGYQETSKCFDLWAVLDGSTVRLATGPSWNAGAVAGSAVVRGTGAGSSELELLAGLYVNKNAMTVRFGSASGNTLAVSARQATYLGTFYAAGDGLATDSRQKRWLDNAFNPTLRPFRYFEPTFSWNYSTATYRQANGSANSQVSWVSGLAGKACDITVHAMSTTSTATPQIVNIAIGIDSATAPAADCNVVFARCVSGEFNLMHSQWVGCAGLGFHEAKWLELGGGADTQTWYGTTAGGGPPLLIRQGLLGSALF